MTRAAEICCKWCSEPLTRHGSFARCTSGPHAWSQQFTPLEDPMIGLAMNRGSKEQKEILSMFLTAAAALATEGGNLGIAGHDAVRLFNHVSRWLSKLAEEDSNPDDQTARMVRIHEDADDLQGSASRGFYGEEEELNRALSVIILTPHIRAYLEMVDPQALKQIRQALRLEGVERDVEAARDRFGAMESACGDDTMVMVRGAIAALSQNATFPADVSLAKQFLNAATKTKALRINFARYNPTEV